VTPVVVKEAPVTDTTPLPPKVEAKLREISKCQYSGSMWDDDCFSCRTSLLAARAAYHLGLAARAKEGS
jgi:hypothetical protein